MTVKCLKGGRLIDPYNGIDEKKDLYFRNGKIVSDSEGKSTSDIENIDDDFLDSDFDEDVPFDDTEGNIDAIDAEFTDFDEPFDDDSDDMPDSQHQETTSAASSNFLANINRKYVLYGGISVFVILMFIFGISLFSGKEKQAIPVAQNTIRPLAPIGEPQEISKNTQNGTGIPLLDNNGQEQTLSSILDTGSLGETSDGSLLDNLDQLDSIDQNTPVKRDTASIDAVPVFKEAETLSSLPMPNPIQNENPGIYSEDLSSGLGEALSDQIPAQNQLATTLPSPFDSSTPNTEQRSPQEILQDLESIQDTAENKLADDSTPARLSRLEDNVSHFENNTQIFVTNLQDLKDNLANRPSPADVSEMNRQFDLMNVRIEELETELAKSKKATSKAKPITKKAAKRPKTHTKPKITWELRAASPGQAWVSEKGKTELKQVSIGDKLTGLGTIRSIALQNNRWKVTGTTGAITQ